MSGRRFRFIHASDLHLEAPVGGLGEVPPHLQDALLDAPFHAAERLFETALSERVDFLLLAGDVAHGATCGPRAFDFLDRWFRQLQAESIPIYWSESPHDQCDRWPTAVPLPENVQVLSSVHVEPITIKRDKKPLAKILGSRGTPDGVIDIDAFDGDASLFTIALVHGYPPQQMGAGSWGKTNVDYWALGGLHNPCELATRVGIARYAGSPQARATEEEGPHGVSIVDVEARHAVRQTIATDTVRWHHEFLELPAHLDQQGLLRMLRERSQQLLDAAAGRQLLVRWTVTDGDQLTDTRSDLLAARLREGALASELLIALRREFGQNNPGLWSVSLDADPADILPSGWYEEDTVLGDLLRSVQQHQVDASLNLQLDTFDLASELTKTLQRRMVISNEEERKRILSHVASLGVDLMRGDRVLSEDAADPPPMI